MKKCEVKKKGVVDCYYNLNLVIDWRVLYVMLKFGFGCGGLLFYIFIVKFMWGE